MEFLWPWAPIALWPVCLFIALPELWEAIRSGARPGTYLTTVVVISIVLIGLPIFACVVFFSRRRT